jgi:hypothetical protein
MSNEKKTGGQNKPIQTPKTDSRGQVGLNKGNVPKMENKPKPPTSKK